VTTPVLTAEGSLPAAANSNRRDRHARAWFDLDGRPVAVLLAVAAALANGVWVLLDHSSPSWDQSNYLHVTWQYQQALDHHGITGLAHSVHSIDPAQAPLFAVLMLPFFYIFGDVQRAGLMLNLVASPILFLSTGEVAYAILRNPRARLLAILLVSTMPLVVGLDHNVLQDFLLMTLATVSILLLLKTDLFRRRTPSLLFALTMALGSLTKVTFLLFVIGPIAIVVGQVIALARSTHVHSGAARQPASLPGAGVNIVGAVALYLCLTLAWYGPNFSKTLAYIRSTTSGPLSLGAGPSDPYTVHAVLSFTAGMMNADVSWVFGLAAIAAALLNIPTLITWWRNRDFRRQGLIDAAFLLSWILIPYLLVALAHNQDVRLMAPAMPGMVVILAGLITAVRWVYVRIILAAATVTASVYQVGRLVTPLQLDFLPAEATLAIGQFDAVIPFQSQSIGYEQLPGKDYTTPIISYIEAVSHAASGHSGGPNPTVCLLESNPIVNGNTFSYLIAARGDAFTIRNITIGPQGPSELVTQLAGCDFALYVKQPPIASTTLPTRLALVNGTFAAEFMTPKLFSLFRSPSRSFYVGGGQRVQILVRR
jgi:hypothetical protein